MGSRAILIIWPTFMSISLDSAGNMVGSKKNVVPNFMFVTKGGGVELAQIPSLEGTSLCLQKTHRSAKASAVIFSRRYFTCKRKDIKAWWSWYELSPTPCRNSSLHQAGTAPASFWTPSQTFAREEPGRQWRLLGFWSPRQQLCVDLSIKDCVLGPLKL